MKTCPFCAEEIQDEAIVCRFCQRDLNSPIKPASSTKRADVPKRTAFYIAALGMIAAAFMPWFNLHVSLGSFRISGIDGDGIITLIVGILIGLIALSYKDQAKKYAPFFILLLSIGALLLVFDKYVYLATQDDTTTGIGLHLTALAAFVGIIASIGAFTMYKPVQDSVS